MTRLLREMFLQPAAALASAAQVFTQRVGRGGRVDALVSRMARALGRTPAGADEYTPFLAATDYGGGDFADEGSAALPLADAADAMRGPTATAVEVTQMATANANAGEKREMDKDLRDDMLKLVRYKVLFVKREYEHAFPEREDLVSDNMDGSAFTAWKIAEFIQQLGRGETRVPHKWSEKGYPSANHRRDGALLGLDEGDKKYLRVYYEVLERYPREKFKYEEQQVRVLEQIRDKL